MKKKLLTAAVLTLCAVALVAGSVFATIALLTSSSGVSNVFTVGNISIDMKESKVNSDGKRLNANGELIEEKGGEIVKVDTNSYHLLPGKTYIKDPTIYITSDTDKMYLFVKSANMIRKAEAGNYNDRVRDADGKVTSEDHTPLSMREQMEANGWVEYVRSGDGTEIVWVYGTRDTETGKIKPEVVSKATHPEIKLCENFTVHPNVDVSVYGAAYVTFTAFAIQTTGFTGAETADEHALTNAAWTAVKNSFPYQCGIVNPINPYNKDKDAYEAVKADKAQFELLDPPPVQKPEDIGGSGAQG